MKKLTLRAINVKSFSTSIQKSIKAGDNSQGIHLCEYSADCDLTSIVNPVCPCNISIPHCP